MAILVTGGAGYVGSHVNKVLNQQGHQTVVFDSLVNGHRDAVRWGEFIQGDLCDKDAIAAVFAEHSIEAVFHFAAYAYVGESVTDPQKYYLNNMVGSLNLLRAMVGTKAPAETPYFVFSSTAATYGIPTTSPIDETHRTQPINPYGRTKLMIENVLADYAEAYGLQYAALRYFNAAGADPEGEIGERHDPETHLIPLILDVAIGKRPHIKIFGTDYDTEDGSCVRDYIHVTDLASAHILALDYLRRGGKSGAFNLGTETGFSVREVIAAARQISNKPIEAIETERRPGDPDTLVASANKARQVLGWKPQLGELKQVLETAWHWHQKTNTKH